MAMMTLALQRVSDERYYIEALKHQIIPPSLAVRISTGLNEPLLALLFVHAKTECVAEMVPHP